MLYRSLACGALLGSLALQVAASPLGHQQHAAADTLSARTPLSSKNHRRSIPDTHVVHERQLPHWADTWSAAEAVPGNVNLPMRIGLKQQNLQVGHDMLMAMSDPKSDKFGKHLTSDEVIDLFAPDRSSVDAVVNWLTGAGIDIDRISQSANKQWLQFDAQASEAEDLLMTKYYIFEHGASGTRDIAAEHYYLPHEVREHIDYITPGTRLRWDAKKAEREDIKRRGFAAAYINQEPVDIEDAIQDVIEEITDTITDITDSLTDVFTSGTGSSTDASSSDDVSSTTSASISSATSASASSVSANGVTSSGASSTGASSKDCTTYLLPHCIKDQYGIPNGTTATEGNELGIFESLSQHYSKADLDSYFALMYPTIPNGTYPIERLIDGAIGAVAVGKATSESSLDFQAAMPIIYPQNAVLFQVDDEVIQKNETLSTTPYLGFLNNFFDAIDGSYCTFSAYGETGNCVKPECLDPAYPDPLPGGYNGTLQCGVFEPTNVISISYSGAEIDVPSYYWRRQCAEIMKLGLQGVTVVISSGDYGVASYAGDINTVDGCLGTDSRAGTVFNPASQATCPYVLAVGATSLNEPSDNTSTTYVEHAAQRFASGGGFSNYFDRPSYQDDAVETYFSNVDLNFTGYYDTPENMTELESITSGVFRITGRGYPDVSAVGERFMTRMNTMWNSIGGTSLSAPIWASMLTLINEERLALGKNPIGFVNQIFYEHPEVFNDITEGDNPGCNSDGFPAAEGWDPVTGLGSPNYPKLLALLTSLD